MTEIEQTEHVHTCPHEAPIRLCAGSPNHRGETDDIRQKVYTPAAKRRADRDPMYFN